MGNVFSHRHLLYSEVNDGVIARAIDFSSLLLNPSDPVALWTLSFIRTLNTSDSVTSIIVRVLLSGICCRMLLSGLVPGFIHGTS